MSEKREILGVWWLPEKPEERWVGTLTLNGEGSPRLLITVPKQFSFIESTVPPIINGHNEQGKPITLLFPGLFRTIGGLAISQKEFRAGYVIIGMEISNHLDFHVNSLTLRMQHLFEWVDASGISEEEPKTLDSFHLKYTRPEELSFAISDKLSVELNPTFSFQDGIQQKRFEEDMLITFESKEGLDLVQTKQLITATRSLLHFAVLKKVFPINIAALKDGHGVRRGEDFFQSDIEIYNSIIKERVESEIDDRRWLFKFGDLKPKFGEFMSNWLRFLEDFQEALGCYFMTMYHRPPDSVEFLSLAQALEAYHGIKYASHKTVSFEKKIFALTDTHKDQLKGLIDDPAEFAKAVTVNRHYYTHHNPKDKKGGLVFAGANLFRLSEKARIVFQMCVLSEIGIPKERFSRLRRQLATQIVDYV